MFGQSNLQNSPTSMTSPSRCSDGVMQQDLGENNQPPLAAEVVSNCCPKSNEKMEDGITHKGPSEQREIQTAMLHSEDLAAVKSAGLQVLIEILIAIGTKSFEI